jgi:hypothetical protein
LGGPAADSGLPFYRIYFGRLRPAKTGNTEGIIQRAGSIPYFHISGFAYV